MKIDILCTDGSPLGVSMASINGDDGRQGVGGAELALLTMCELWSKRGDQVRLYNDPDNRASSIFEQLPKHKFEPENERDVVIDFRTPNRQVQNAKGLKVWWSCDQHTSVPFQGFDQVVDKIVCISPFHVGFFRETYGFYKQTCIDIPVRVWEYENKNIDKVPHRIIFNSVPDRGLQVLRDAWPMIKEADPLASLVITSDYRLWGLPDPNNVQHRMKFAGWPDVFFKGAITRNQLIEEELKADVHAYPCTYDELFCIAMAETQVAGAYPVSTDIGALGTTNMGLKVRYQQHYQRWIQEFIDLVVSNLQDPNLPVLQKLVQKSAIDRFSPERILREWDNVFNG